MAIEDIKQLKTVNHQAPAQQLLNEGWTLLAVCVKQDGADQYSEYHLGKPVEDSPVTPPIGVMIPSRVRTAKGPRTV